MPPLVRPPSAVARVWQDSQVSLSLSERERLTPPPLLSHSLTLSLAHSLTLSRTLSLAQRERGFGGDAATGQSPFRCRASLALTRQSRPDVGLGLSHLQYEGVNNLLSCSLLARQLVSYRGTSLVRNRTHLGPYSRTMPLALGGPEGGAFSYERGTSVILSLTTLAAPLRARHSAAPSL